MIEFRRWVGPTPPQCAEAWHVVADGDALMAIFRVLPSNTYRLVYHEEGRNGGTVEQHATMDLAKMAGVCAIATKRLMVRSPAMAIQ